MGHDLDSCHVLDSSFLVGRPFLEGSSRLFFGAAVEEKVEMVDNEREVCKRTYRYIGSPEIVVMTNFFLMTPTEETSLMKQKSLLRTQSQFYINIRVGVSHQICISHPMSL